MIEWIEDNWKIIVVIATAIAGITAWVKNILHVKNLSLQNKNINKKDNQKNEYEKLYPNFIQAYNIDYSEKIERHIENGDIDINDLIRKLSYEFSRHFLFSKIDYISIPIPVKSGLFIFLTKENNNITIEDVGKSLIIENWYDNWSSLTREYNICFNLSFRKDHLILRNQSQYNYTKLKIKDLYNSLESYYFSIIPNIEREKATVMYNLKGNIAKAIELAEKYYESFQISDNSNDLGQVAINFDIVISSIHKIIVEIKPTYS